MRMSCTLLGVSLKHFYPPNHLSQVQILGPTLETDVISAAATVYIPVLFIKRLVCSANKNETTLERCLYILLQIMLNDSWCYPGLVP